MYPVLFSYFTLNINMIFARPQNDTLLRFVKIDNVNNYKIKNNTKYLAISFSEKYKNMDNNYSIYNYIKNNDKSLIIINDENEKRYSYLIKNKNNFKCKYQLKYNQKNYRYLFDITSNEIENKKTFWNIVVKVNEISNFKFIIFQIMNWINFIIDTNIKHFYLKKYIIICYLINLSLY